MSGPTILAVIDGTAGDDTLLGTVDDDTIRGLGGADEILGGAGNDSLFGGDADDTITTGENANVPFERDDVSGGAGNDRIIVSRGTEEGTIAGDEGDDRVRVQGAFRGTLEGGSGSDTLELSSGIVDLRGATIEGFEASDLRSVFVDIDTANVDRLGAVTIGGASSVRVADAGDLAFQSLALEAGARLQIEAAAPGTRFVAPTGVTLGNGALLDFNGGAGDDEATGFDGADLLDGGAGDDQLDGGAGNDSIQGGAGNDTLIGGAGDDTLATGPNGGSFGESDIVRAGAGDDLIEKGAVTAAGELYGEAGDDTFVMFREFAGRVDGGDGVDTLSFGPGSAGLSGSTIAGIERTLVERTRLTIDAEDVGDLGEVILSGDVTFLLSSAGTATFSPMSAAPGATLVVVADAGGSTVRFDAATAVDAYTFEGGAGDDDAVGRGGADVMTGGAGNDTLAGGGGNDLLEGGIGDDVLRGGAGDDTLRGDDTVPGGTGGFDTFTGGSGADTFIVENDAVITDLSTDDVIRLQNVPSTGLVNVVREGADALLQVDRNADGFVDYMIRVEGGAAFEYVIEIEDFIQTVRAAQGSSGPGTPGDDDLVGTPGSDTLDGLGGNDRILGLGSADTLIGGDGHDTVDGGEGADSILGGTGDDDLSTGQTIAPGAADADTLEGGGGDDTLTAERGSGMATLSGGSDDDAFRIATALPFAGSIDGGAGTDTLDLTGSAVDLSQATIANLEQTVLGGAPVTVRPDQMASLGAVSFEGAGGQLRMASGGEANVAGLTLGADQVLTVSGGSDGVTIDFGDAAQVEGRVYFFALGGDNVVTGAAGADTLRGGEGADQLSGSQGADNVFGGGGADTLAGGAGSDTVGGGDGDDLVDGGAGDDTLSGEGGNDTVFGGAGDDVIFLGAGDDVVTDTSGETRIFALEQGNSGLKTITTGAGADTISLASRFGTSVGDIVAGDGDDSVWGGRGADTVQGGAGEDEIVGGEGADELSGGADDDTLWGGAGDDTLNGGEGNDVAFGGDGDDTFVSGGGFDVFVGGTGENSFTFDPEAGGLYVGGDDLTISEDMIALMSASGQDDAAVEAVLSVLEVVPSTPAARATAALTTAPDEDEIEGVELELNGGRVDTEDLYIYVRDGIHDPTKTRYTAFNHQNGTASIQITGTSEGEEISLYSRREGVNVLDGGAGDDILTGGNSLGRGGSGSLTTIYRGGPGDDIYTIYTYSDQTFIFDDYEPNETIVIEDGALVTTLPDDGNGARFQVTDRNGNVATLRFDPSVDPADVFFQEQSDFERVQQITRPQPDPAPPDVPDDPTPPDDPDGDDDDDASGPTPPPPPSGPESDMFGQPGIVTLDGAFYDFQGVGEFTLVRSTDPARPLEVQVRTEALGEAVSVITAVAVDAGGERIVIDASGNPPLSIDGVATEVGGRPVLLGDGSQIFEHDGKLTVVLATGEQIMVGLGEGRLDICVFLDDLRAGLVEGLMGNADGDHDNDLAFPQADGGAVLPQPVDFGALYGAFADAWRVTDATSLFDYAPGEGTENFQDRSFPPFAISLDDLPDDVVAMATAAVDAAGVTDPILRDAAIMDVALTGDVSFAQTARELAADPTTVLEPDPASLPPAPQLVGIGSLAAEVLEGSDASPTAIAFVLYRTGDLSAALTVDWQVEGDVDAADFADGVVPSGTATFQPGEREIRLEFAFAADTAHEDDENLVVTIDAADVGKIIGSVTTIVRDDDPDGVLSLEASRSDNAVSVLSNTGEVRVTAGDLAGLEEAGVSQIVGSRQDDTITVARTVMRPLLVETGDGDDVVRAGRGADTVTAGIGDDLVLGRAGNDTVDGDAGDDTLIAGPGDDVVRGGAHDDRIEGQAGNDTLDGGTGHDIVLGGKGADVLRGGSGNDTLSGQRGDDTVQGDAGDDRILGRHGNDVLDGGFGQDTVRGAQGEDTISGGDGNDRLIGNEAADVLDGGNGNDTIFGGEGGDILIGGAGDDTLIGGAGPDRYVLGPGADVVRTTADDLDGDIIEGFGHGDRLAVRHADFERSDIDVTIADGAATLSIDTDSDGISDTVVTLEGSFDDGEFMVVGSGPHALVSFEPALPALQERAAVPQERINGVINERFFTNDGDKEFSVTLRDIGFAGYDNVLGAYDIGPDGAIHNVRILFDNVKEDRSASTVVSDVGLGDRLGFFIVQDASDWASSLSADDLVSFLDPTDEVATIFGGAPQLAVNGLAVDEVVFHSASAALNPDRIEHALSGADPSGRAISIGFEDLLGGGDRDYEDVVFTVALAIEAALF